MLKCRVLAVAICTVVFTFAFNIASADSGSLTPPNAPEAQSPDAQARQSIENARQLLTLPATQLDIGLFRLEQHATTVATRMYQTSDRFQFDEALASGSPQSIDLQLNFDSKAVVTETGCIAELERYSAALFTRFQTVKDAHLPRFDQLELYGFFAPADGRILHYKTYADEQKVMAELVNMFRLRFNFVDSVGNTECSKSKESAEANRILFPND